MFTRKALDGAVDHAGAQLWSAADAHARALRREVVTPLSADIADLREDVALAALTIAGGLAVLGFCIVAAAVVVSDGR